LKLQKSVSPSSVNVNATVTFTLVVTNQGPDAASGVQIKDQMPNGFTYVSSTASQGTYNSATGTWDIGNMTVNGTATLTIVTTVNASGSYTNTAELISSLLVDPDSMPNNNNPSEDDQSSAAVTIRAPRSNPTPTGSSSAAFFIPVTGFKAGVATDLSHVKHETYTSASDVTLDVPSLGVKIPIVGVPKKDGTWNVAWLEDEAGWLQGSAFPSWNGNSVLTGHVYLASGLPGPFVNLNKLKYGDQIVVHAYGQKYIFAVQTNEVVAPNDNSVMKHEEKPWLTLITCKDYDEKTKTYRNRVVVRAALLKVEWDK
jgi:LPXTG-site transpeptidase (sortase) family protein